MKIIFSDIDGTLIHSDGSIGLLNKLVIQTLISQGVRFCIASGRFLRGIDSVREAYGLEKEPVIAANGAYAEADGKCIFRGALDEKTVLGLASIIHSHGAVPVLYAGFDWFMEADGPWFKRQKAFYPFSGIIESFESVLSRVPEGAAKIVARSDSPSSLRLIADETARAFPDIGTMLSSSSLLEFSPTNLSKGAAASAILDYYGWKREDAAAFGDFDNDLSLLSAVKYGFAMKNGSASLLSAGLPVTRYTNDEDGVARELIRLLNLKI